MNAKGPLLRLVASMAAVLLLTVSAQTATTLARIETDPTAYAGQEVVLVGYMWSWYKPQLPEICEGLPAPKGNTLYTRSDGSFCDGTRVAYLPPVGRVKLRGQIKPGQAIQLVARVHIGPEGWWLEPVEIR